MKSILSRWGGFLKVIADPWVIFLAASTVYLGFALVNQPNKDVVTILTFIISVTAGILGGILGKRWDDLIDEKVITARGKSATRDLKLLLRSIASLESRVRQYLERFVSTGQDEDKSTEVATIYFEEIIERCNIIEEQVINATENWIDVVPDIADVSTQIGVITDLKDNIALLNSDLESVSDELAATRDRSAEEVGRLRKEKRQIEVDLYAARQELRNRAIDSGLMSGGSVEIYGPYASTVSPHQVRQAFLGREPELGRLSDLELRARGGFPPADTDLNESE